VPDLFFCGIVGGEDQAAVQAEPGPVGQQLPEGDGVHTRAFNPVRRQKRRDPAVDAQVVAGQRLQHGNRGEHLADAGDVHHAIGPHGEFGRVSGRAGQAGGNHVRPAAERDVSDGGSPQLGIDAVRQPAERNARMRSTDTDADKQNRRFWAERRSTG